VDAGASLMHDSAMGQVNHRVRVAALRRERMRSRLLEAGLSILGQADDEPAIIDEVISRAQVSRGTFYNYFDNADDLLRSIADEAGTELMAVTTPIVVAHDDPAERISTGVRAWISLVEQYPHLAPFFRRAGLYILENDRVRSDLPRDLLMGMKAGRFTIRELELGFVLVAGTVLAAINTMAVGPAPRTYGSKLAERVLMSLGVDAADAKIISRAKIARPKLQGDSLIVRSKSVGC
jgi:TetR/AcrR family transcriptional regulator, ethionamide resistance regulator